MYLVFGGLKDYRNQGWEQFKGSFVNVENAKRCGHNLLINDECDWVEIVDLETESVVFALEM